MLISDQIREENERTCYRFLNDYYQDYIPQIRKGNFIRVQRGESSKWKNVVGEI